MKSGGNSGSDFDLSLVLSAERALQTLTKYTSVHKDLIDGFRDMLDMPPQLSTSSKRFCAQEFGTQPLKAMPWTNFDFAGLVLGARVRILPETDARRGIVSYVGHVPEIPGIGSWVGITLDEPTGKNDGTVNGKPYFECGKNYGVFVRPERCEVGDFPPLDLGDEDLEEL